MLNVRDWKWVFGLIQYVCDGAYRRGLKDAVLGKALEKKDFVVNPAMQLQLQKQYAEFLKK